MDLTYYDIYAYELAMSPNQDYRSGLQAIVNAQWDNTTTRYVIEREIEIGSCKYEPIQAYINHVINESTTGRKNGDDFRKLIFKKVSQGGFHNDEVDNVRGEMYRFNDNYWVTTFTDSYNGESLSVIVRRCNNFAKYIDKVTGDIISIPCILDYTATSAAPKYTEDIVTPDNHVTLIVQGNEKTIPWKQNQRFIFNGRPFKVTGFNDYMQNEYVDQNTTILYFDLYLDEIQPTDDIENNIANRFEYNYTMNILQDNFSVVTGSTGNLKAEVKLNGEVVNRPLFWRCKPRNAATIDNEGNYTILAETGTEIEFSVVMSKYKTVQATVMCQVVESLPSVRNLVIEPVIESIPQAQTRIFEVSVYIDNVKQDVNVDYVVSGPSTSNYRLVRENNIFTLTNIRMSTIPLRIIFSYENISEQIEIKLKSAF